MEHGGKPQTHEISDIRLPVDLGTVIKPGMLPVPAIVTDAVERTSGVQILSEHIPSSVNGEVVRHLARAIVGIILNAQFLVREVQRQQPAERRFKPRLVDPVLMYSLNIAELGVPTEVASPGGQRHERRDKNIIHHAPIFKRVGEVVHSRRPPGAQEITGKGVIAVCEYLEALTPAVPDHSHPVQTGLAIAFPGLVLQE